MRASYVLAALVAAAFFAAPGSSAQAATYCLVEDTTTCGFVSLQQCLDTMWGRVPGHCILDPMDAGAPPPPNDKKRQ